MHKKEMTTPCASVGADAEQSSSDLNNSSINNFDENIKCVGYMPSDVFGEASDLQTLTLNELYEQTYLDSPPIINNLLYPGTYLFVGTPKVGKSFLMLQIAYHISTGIPMWGYETTKGTVLYFALEDRYNRLQKRMYKMFGEKGNDDMYLATSSGTLSTGLIEQIEKFIDEHSDTKLVIIDTFKRILDDDNESYSYKRDYDIMTQIKSISDRYDICLLVVHHTRKQPSKRKQSQGDIFEDISGTQGLLGAADGGFVLHKDFRGSTSAELDVVGRDQADQKFILERDVESLYWKMESVEEELWKEPPDPLLEEISKNISEENPLWTGTPTRLKEMLNIEMNPNTISMRLNINASRLMNEYGILYEKERTHDGRIIKLTFKEKA